MESQCEVLLASTTHSHIINHFFLCSKLSYGSVLEMIKIWVSSA